jgi:uncharacterized protein (TIGR03083 family)
MTVIEELTEARAELLAAVAGMDEAALDRGSLLGGWSVKNLLAHMAAWESWVVEMIQARLSSAELPAHLRAATADEDAYNAAQVAEREELTPDEQLMELERNRAELLALLDRLGPALLDAPEPWPGAQQSLSAYLRGSLVRHEREHTAALRSALQGR